MLARQMIKTVTQHEAINRDYFQHTSIPYYVRQIAQALIIPEWRARTENSSCQNAELALRLGFVTLYRTMLSRVRSVSINKAGHVPANYPQPLIIIPTKVSGDIVPPSANK